jgi:hypothetical protein
VVEKKMRFVEVGGGERAGSGRDAKKVLPNVKIRWKFWKNL